MRGSSQILQDLEGYQWIGDARIVPARCYCDLHSQSEPMRGTRVAIKAERCSPNLYGNAHGYVNVQSSKNLGAYYNVADHESLCHAGDR